MISEIGGGDEGSVLLGLKMRRWRILGVPSCLECVAG